MPRIIEGPPAPDAPRRPVLVKLAWFAGLALAGAGATALLAYALRALIL